MRCGSIIFFCISIFMPQRCLQAPPVQTENPVSHRSAIASHDVCSLDPTASHIPLQRPALACHCLNTSKPGYSRLSQRPVQTCLVILQQTVVNFLHMQCRHLSQPGNDCVFAYLMKFDATSKRATIHSLGGTIVSAFCHFQSQVNGAAPEVPFVCPFCFQ